MAGIPPREKCALCGKYVFMPFRCNYCGKIYCIDHYLPKDHNCPGLRYREKEPERIIIYPSPDTVSKGPAHRPKKKKIRAGIVIAVILSVIMFAVFQNFTTPTQTFYIEEEIELLVKELGYNDEVAQYVARDVNSWTGFWGDPLLHEWKEELSNAKEKYEGNKFARVEVKITKKLSKKIKKEIPDYETFKWDLEDVIRDEEANCLGYTQLFFILGEVVGLPVEPVHVIESEESSVYGYEDFSRKLRRSLESERNVIPSHIACLVNLSNDHIVFVELSASSPVISKPLILEKRYDANGTYMEAKYVYHRDILYYTRIRVYGKNGKEGLISSIFNSRACDHTKLGNYEMAISNFTKAIEIDPKNVLAYNNRGSICISQGDYEMAISDYTKAIEIDPNFALTYYKRGHVYKSLGEYRKAISDFTNAIDSDLEHVEAYFYRGHSYFALQEYEKAIEDFTEVIDSHRFRAPVSREIWGELSASTLVGDAYNYRGFAYLAIGEKQKAEEDFKMPRSSRKLGG